MQRTPAHRCGPERGAGSSDPAAAPPGRREVPARADPVGLVGAGQPIAGPVVGRRTDPVEGSRLYATADGPVPFGGSQGAGDERGHGATWLAWVGRCRIGARPSPTGPLLRCRTARSS